MATAAERPDEAAQRVARARASSSPAESVAWYRTWAPGYDHDVFDVLGITGSNRIAELLAARVVNRSAPVLDLGCGTGAVGVRLGELGFASIDGVDISPEMLAIAVAKGAYRDLIVADLSEPLPLTVPIGYGASVSAGTFTSGHVGPDSLHRILSLHRSGATLAWVIASSVWESFEPALAAAGVVTVSAELEPIRAGGPPEAVMFVGRLQ